MKANKLIGFSNEAKKCGDYHAANMAWARLFERLVKRPALLKRFSIVWEEDEYDEYFDLFTITSATGDMATIPGPLLSERALALAKKMSAGYCQRASSGPRDRHQPTLRLVDLRSIGLWSWVLRTDKKRIESKWHRLENMARTHLPVPGMWHDPAQWADMRLFGTLIVPDGGLDQVVVEWGGKDVERIRVPALWEQNQVLASIAALFPRRR